MTPSRTRLLLLSPLVVILVGSLCQAESPPSSQAALAQAPAQARPQNGTPQTPATAQASELPSLAPLVESVKSSVVNVEVQSRVSSPRMGQGTDLFEHFFGGPMHPRQPQREQYRQGAGSGVIIDGKGLVLTNNHVVEGAVAIKLRLDDGREFAGKILGRDPLTDMAVVQLQGKVEKLPVAKLGDSDAVRVGDWVVAIGNPFGLASSVSTGILSARSRTIGAGPYDDFLQTDAAINPGNSGGPLFNLRGEVIGINTAIVGGGTGIGFAVPINMAKALLPQLQSSGQVTRGWLGIYIQELTADIAKGLNVPVTKGAIVTGFVSDASPGKKAGLQVDDVIVAVDGQTIESDNGLTRNVALKRPGSTSTFTVYRDGQKRDIKVTLEKRPQDVDGLRSEETESTEERQQRIGLDFQNIDPRMANRLGLPPKGALITAVVPGSPADRAGLTAGMAVIEAGGKPVANAQELAKLIRGAKSGSVLLLRVQFEGGRQLRALQIP